MAIVELIEADDEGYKKAPEKEKKAPAKKAAKKTATKKAATKKAATKKTAKKVRRGGRVGRSSCGIQGIIALRHFFHKRTRPIYGRVCASKIRFYDFVGFFCGFGRAFALGVRRVGADNFAQAEQKLRENRPHIDIPLPPLATASTPRRSERTSWSVRIADTKIPSLNFNNPQRKTP